MATRRSNGRRTVSDLWLKDGWVNRVCVKLIMILIMYAAGLLRDVSQAQPIKD